MVCSLSRMWSLSSSMSLYLSDTSSEGASMSMSVRKYDTTRFTTAMNGAMVSIRCSVNPNASCMLSGKYMEAMSQNGFGYRLAPYGYALPAPKLGVFCVAIYAYSLSDSSSLAEASLSKGLEDWRPSSVPNMDASLRRAPSSSAASTVDLESVATFLFSIMALYLGG